MTPQEMRVAAAHLAAELFSHTRDKQEAQELVRLLEKTIEWVYADGGEAPQGSTP